MGSDPENKPAVTEKRGFGPYVYVKNKLHGISPMYYKLSGIEFLFWFAAATGSYLTVFLKQNGFTPTQVGLINSINSAVAIAASPFWGMISDKLRSIRKVFLICMAIGATLWATIPAAIRVPLGPILLGHLMIPIGSFFRQPANSLVDAFVVQTAAQNNVAYGNVRLWGSISYAIMSFGLAAVLPIVGVEVTFYFYGIAFLPMMFIMWRMKDVEVAGSSAQRRSVPLREMQLGKLFKNYYFLTYLIFSIVYHLPMNTSMTFLPYLVEMVGGDAAQLGLVVGYKALLEIPMLLLIKPLRKRVSLPMILLLSNVFYIAEFLLYSSAQSLLAILAIQTLHGLAGGITIGTATNYVYALAPEGLNGTAHTVNGSMNSIAAIIGNSLGGILMEAIGIRGFYQIAAYIVIGASVFFIFTLWFGQKVLKKPLPERARISHA